MKQLETIIIDANAFLIAIHVFITIAIIIIAAIAILIVITSKLYVF